MLVLIGLLITGCTKPPKKPFIIVSRSTIYQGYISYTYTDKSGNFYTFYDKADKYSVGDTIK